MSEMFSAVTSALFLALTLIAAWKAWRSQPMSGWLSTTVGLHPVAVGVGATVTGAPLFALGILLSSVTRGPASNVGDALVLTSFLLAPSLFLFLFPRFLVPPALRECQSLFSLLSEGKRD